jgi:hypothetical protein
MFILAIIPNALLRIIMFILFLYYSNDARRHSKVISSHELLHNGTYNLNFAAGEKLAGQWGHFGFIWNFVVGLCTFWLPAPFNAPFTVVDTIVAVYLAKATHYQTPLIPHSKGSCNNAAYDWAKPPGANESYFEAVARLNGTVTTPVNMCKSFVREWQYGVSVS